jgi:hypothetical protein
MHLSKLTGQGRRFTVWDTLEHGHFTDTLHQNEQGRPGSIPEALSFLSFKLVAVIRFELAWNDA